MRYQIQTTTTPLTNSLLLSKIQHIVNYLSVENISKSFGTRVLFENISFGINEGQKIGFIAKNGTGKTSLLKIISGEDVPDTGMVTSRRDLKIAFLSQEPNLNPDLTIEQTIFSSDNPMLKIIETYEKAILNPTDSEALQQAMDAMDAHNAWDFETQYKQILFQLKLEDLDKKVSNLSGGQKKATCVGKYVTHLTRSSDFRRAHQPLRLRDDRVVRKFICKREFHLIYGNSRPLFFGAGL